MHLIYRGERSGEVPRAKNAWSCNRCSEGSCREREQEPIKQPPIKHLNQRDARVVYISKNSCRMYMENIDMFHGIYMIQQKRTGYEVEYKSTWNDMIRPPSMTIRYVGQSMCRTRDTCVGGSVNMDYTSPTFVAVQNAAW